MSTHSMRHAREKLAELADLAEAGEPVRIERRGHETRLLVAERLCPYWSSATDHFLDELARLRAETGGVDFERPAQRPTLRRVR